MLLMHSVVNHTPVKGSVLYILRMSFEINNPRKLGSLIDRVAGGHAVTLRQDTLKRPVGSCHDKPFIFGCRAKLPQSRRTSLCSIAIYRSS